MPKIPTPEELGGLLRMPGSRPIGRYDVSPFAQGAQQIADAGARFGQSVQDVGKATYKAAERQRMLTEATVAGTYIHGRLLSARDRFQNDPDYATLPQRWQDEAGTIVGNGLSLVSNGRLRARVGEEVAPALRQEHAAIQDQAFRGAADAHAANREGFLQHVVQHITLDPNDATTTGAIDSYHANVDDAVTRGYLMPEQAAAEKRDAALRLVGAEYSLMARRDPERAMRELGSPETENVDPLVAHLPQEQRDGLIREAQRRQDGAQADAARATMLAQQQAQHRSDEAEHATIKDLLAGSPSVNSDAILGNAALTDDAKGRVLGAIARTTQPEPTAEVSDAAAVELIDRIRRRDGDTERIADVGPIVDAYNAGNLRHTGLDFVARQLDKAQTPDGAAMAQRTQALIGSIQPLIDQQVRDSGVSAASQRYALERDIDSAIQQYRAEGKNPLDLFNQSKADYLGTPEMLQAYVEKVGFQPISPDGLARFIRPLVTNPADPNGIRRPPFGIPPSPLDAWQRERQRGNEGLARSILDLADYLRGLFNKPTDDKEPENGKPRLEGEATSPPNPAPENPPPLPPPVRAPSPRELEQSNEPQPAEPETSRSSRFDPARTRRDARRTTTEREAHSRAARQARANANLSKEDADWIDEDPTGRRNELAYDAARKNFRVREARAALAAEEQGLVEGPLRRPPGSQEMGGDFEDRNGTLWDHTQVTVAEKEKAMEIIARKANAAGGGKNTLADLLDLSPSDAKRVVDQWKSRQHPRGTGPVIFITPKGY